MIIYEKVKRFNSITGEPIEKWVEKEIRCDYTGEILEMPELERLEYLLRKKLLHLTNCKRITDEELFNWR